jgi:hypothetical protein
VLPSSTRDVEVDVVGARAVGVGLLDDVLLAAVLALQERADAVGREELHGA